MFQIKNTQKLNDASFKTSFCRFFILQMKRTFTLSKTRTNCLSTAQVTEKREGDGDNQKE